MNLLKLSLYIQSIFLTVTFSNCYKFNCQYSRYIFYKKCYLLFSVTEESYKYAFLCIIPRDLKPLLLQYSAVDRFKSVGLLTKTNTLLKQTLTKQNLRCIAAGFNYKPRNLAGVLILQSEIAVRNFNKEYDVDMYGKRIHNGNPGYQRRKWGILKTFDGNKRNFMEKNNCPYSCSRSK